MPRMLKDWRFHLILGLVFLMCAIVLPTQDRFVMTTRGHKRIITRSDDPAIYWSVEAAIASVSFVLFASGIYRRRGR